MGTNKGRRARKKRRQRLKQSSARTVSLCHENQFVELRKWLYERGFQCNSLTPVQFSDTGRGLMTTKFIQAGDVLISLPERCLLTTGTVLQSYLGDYIRRWKPAISPLLALCAFLISERHLGTVSQWKPYTDILPTSYTCPVYFSDEIVGLLPRTLRRKVLRQRNVVLQLHTRSQAFFKSLQPLFNHSVEDIFTHDALRWAWCSVNSRTVYMEHHQSPDLSTDPNIYALAPFLDLLNHSPGMQVEAGFNQVTRCYEIQSMQDFKRYQQTFICYGPHDSQRLLLEYGFVAPNNPHSVVYVDPDMLQQYFETDKQFAQKTLFLKERGFLRNLTFGPDGPSWKLMTVLRLLSLKPEQYGLWKSVLLGAAVSHDIEEQSLGVARLLCHHLKKETTEALERLSLMKMDAGVSLREQLTVVECLRNEEHWILRHSMEVFEKIQTKFG